MPKMYSYGLIFEQMIAFDALPFTIAREPTSQELMCLDHVNLDYGYDRESDKYPALRDILFGDSNFLTIRP